MSKKCQSITQELETTQANQQSLVSSEEHDEIAIKCKELESVIVTMKGEMSLVTSELDSAKALVSKLQDMAHDTKDTKVPTMRGFCRMITYTNFSILIGIKLKMNWTLAFNSTMCLAKGYRTKTP